MNRAYSTSYTDFLVNEILPGGTVVHLDNLKVPKPPRSQATLGFPERAMEKPRQTTQAESVSEEKATQTIEAENISKERAESTSVVNEDGQGPPEKASGASAWRQFAGTGRAFTVSSIWK